MAARPQQALPNQAPKNVNDAREFRIFSELEKSASKTDDAMNLADLRNMIQLIQEGEKFIKKLNSNMFSNDVDLAIAMKRDKKLVAEYRKKKTKINPSKIKKNQKEIIKTKMKIKLLKSAVDKIKKYEDLYKEFALAIKDSGSPQQVDLYIASIEGEQAKLMGNPSEKDNPVELKKIIRFLQKKEKEARKKEALAQTNVGAAVKRVTASNAVLPFRVVAPYLPNDLESWVHEGVTANQLKEAIVIAKKKHDEAYKRIINSEKITDKAMFQNKIKLLDQMIKYAENSKHNFDRKLNYSSRFYTTSSLLSVLGLAVIPFMLIPGANLVADGIKKVFEFATFGTLVAAQATDPNASTEVKLAARRHYETIKRYNLGETVFAAIGTLTLATAAILPLTAAVLAAPVLPVLLIAGAATMSVSNIISAVSSYKQYTHANSVLKEKLAEKLKKNPQYDIENIKARAAQGDKTLVKDDKILIKDSLHVNELWSRFKSRASAAVGGGLMTFLAGAAVAALVGFPPLGAAVLTGIAVATAVSAVYSAYHRHQEKKLAKAAYRVNEEIHSEDIRNGLDTIRPDLPDLKKSVNENPKQAILHAANLNATVHKATVHSVTTPSVVPTPPVPATTEPILTVAPAASPELPSPPSPSPSPLPSLSPSLSPPPVPERPKNKHLLLERHKQMLKSKDKPENQSAAPHSDQPKGGSKKH